MDDKDPINSRVKSTIALAITLGGLKIAAGIEGIMDGLCPDCGKADHERCFNIEDAPDGQGERE